MAYTVLARKYRSRSFDDVIGQEPIATTLANAIKSGRIHHGYLFTGTRGVGKTSMARILAKALNCLRFDAPTTTPCCECEACRAIAEGQDIDVVEIDAASNTGVDNIRELRSNATYRPARSRFKIYIIDEVHMLSTGAFNALLKTLEEPPDHVKFILATTELQKVPATIQSRCQRYVFKNIGPDEIAARLEQIVRQEGAKAEPAVLRRVARLANGSMRDALSILDQLLSVSPDRLTSEVLDELLPPAQDEQVFRLLSRVAEGDVPGALLAVDEILQHGRGLDVFCGDVLDTLRTLMIVRACGPDSAVADIPSAARDEYAALAARFELSQYVQMIAMLEELRRNARFSSAGRALADAVIVRLAHMTQWAPIERVIAHLPAAAAASAPAAAAPAPAAAAEVPAAAGGEKKKLARPPHADVNPPADSPAEPPAGRPVYASRAESDVIPAKAQIVSPPAAVNPLDEPVPAALAAASLARDTDRLSAPAAAPAALESPDADTDDEAEMYADVAVETPDAEAYRGDDVDLAAEPAAPAADADPALESDSGGEALAPAARTRPASREEQEQILRDPLVAQLVDLFEAEIVNLQIRADAAAAAEPTE